MAHIEGKWNIFFPLINGKLAKSSYFEKWSFTSRRRKAIDDYKENSFVCNYVFRFIASGRLHAKIDKVTSNLETGFGFFLVYLWHWPKFEINVKF